MTVKVCIVTFRVISLIWINTLGISNLISFLLSASEVQPQFQREWQWRKASESLLMLLLLCCASLRITFLTDASCDVLAHPINFGMLLISTSDPMSGLPLT